MTKQLPLSDITRKRIGQFFTGVPLGRLLAALADAPSAESVIDPMSGSGDMIAATLSLNPDAEAAAIEIEPGTAQLAAERLGRDVAVICGNAFDPGSWAGLRDEWDLVITNPPYVRYQVGSAPGEDGLDVPSAERIRAGLIEQIESSTNLDPDERVAFLHCARTYSGLSDLAVPSWLLCASKVATGGRLALVVPNTWLSRDYAAPVLYVIRRLFDLECIVEDGDAAWFSDALVRTTLVVARRSKDKGTAFGPHTHLRIALPGSLADARSIVATPFPDTPCPELEFARAVTEAREGSRDDIVTGVAARVSDESDLVEGLRAAKTSESWPCTEQVNHPRNPVPEILRLALPPTDCELLTLEELGWQVGQGIRTGANDFFYVTRLADGRYQSPLLPGEPLTLPQDAVLRSVRRQADLPGEGGPAVAWPSSSTYLLRLDQWALPEDIESASGPKPWRQMHGDLARLTRLAASHAYIRGNQSVLLPNLSAVRTNIRAGSGGQQRPARFWYHLPPLAPRHRPYIYLARVNGGRPLAFVNADDRVVDANFSTLWPVAPDALRTPVMLSLLRTSWAHAFLETTGTILGGGALKVEATHLRRVVFPKPIGASGDALFELGDQLVSGVEVGDSLDECMEQLLGIEGPRTSVGSLQRLTIAMQAERVARTR